MVTVSPPLSPNPTYWGTAESGLALALQRVNVTFLGVLSSLTDHRSLTLSLRAMQFPSGDSVGICVEVVTVPAVVLSAVVPAVVLSAVVPAVVLSAVVPAVVLSAVVLSAVVPAVVSAVVLSAVVPAVVLSAVVLSAVVPAVVLSAVVLSAVVPAVSDIVVASVSVGVVALSQFSCRFAGNSMLVKNCRAALHQMVKWPMSYTSYPVGIVKVRTLLLYDTPYANLDILQLKLVV